MKKILRNLSTDEGRNFWQTAERAAAPVEAWPAWKRAGINEAQLRQEPRQDSEASTAEQGQRP
jgi:hypothetical protein